VELYLPIAQVSVDWGLILLLGLAVGCLSGLLGVSGGFITTPLLIFYGIPAGVSVATQASPIAASSLVGALRQSGRNSVDVKMGLVLLCGGLAGSSLGVLLFQYLQRLGQTDMVVEISYVLLLGFVGSMMLWESARLMLAVHFGAPPPKVVLKRHTWIHNLPFKTRFRRSGLYISVIPVLVLGLLVVIMTAILGTGGAFLLIPAKIYLFRMRTSLAMGTSQFQMFIVASGTTLMHALTDHTVDVVLAFLLVVGGVVGAQLGSGLSARLKGEQLRVIFAALVLAIAFRLVLGLVLRPEDIYSVILSPPG
jgi:uncharacterized membrane protein YfcA